MDKFKKIRMNFENASQDSGDEKSDISDLMDQTQQEQSKAKSKLKELLNRPSTDDETVDSINLRLLKQMQKN